MLMEIPKTLIIEFLVALLVVYIIVFVIYMLGTKKRRFYDTYHCGETIIIDHKVKYKVLWFYYASLLIAFDALIILVAITSLSFNFNTVIFLILITLSLLFLPKRGDNG